MRAAYGEKTRDFFVHYTNSKLLIDFAGVKFFDSATVDTNMQEYLSETIRAVANMISRNVLARYPNVKVMIPHCGAYLPLMVPRMKSLTAVMQKNGLVGDIDWDRNLAALYYDLAGAHSPETIRMMLKITTPEHLLYGSDYPYVSQQILEKSLDRMKQYLSEEKDLQPYREIVLYKNAINLFQ